MSIGLQLFLPRMHRLEELCEPESRFSVSEIYWAGGLTLRTLELANELKRLLMSPERVQTASHFMSYAARLSDSSDLPHCLRLAKKGNDRLLEFSVLSLWWFSKTQRPNCMEGTEEQDYLVSFVSLCNRFGFFDVASTAGERYINDVLKARDLCSTSPSWRFAMAYAKALRGEGRYDAASDVYRRLATRIGGVGDILSEATLLMTMGKAAHTHLWRAGYYKCLVGLAAKRFKLIAASEDLESPNRRQATRSLAICMDSIAMVDFETHQFVSHSATDAGLAARLQDTWKAALEYAREAGNQNSEIRILCRRAFARFHLSPSTEEKEHALAAYYDALRVLENMPHESRGLAVRYGQYAEMLSTLGFQEEAARFAKRSMTLAANVRDWRTLASNQVRCARIYATSERAGVNDVQEALDVALSVLKNLREPLPELEVQVRLELAQRLRELGLYSDSKVHLEQAQQVVKRLEDRLNEDLARGVRSVESARRNSGKFAQYMPTALVTRSERLQFRHALLIDFQLYSALLRRIATDLLQTADLAAKQASTILQLEFLHDFLQGQAHKFKDILEDFDAGFAKQRNEYEAALRNQNVRDPLAGLLDALTNCKHRLEDVFAELMVSPAQFECGERERMQSVSVRQTAKEVISQEHFSSFFPAVRLLVCDPEGDDSGDFYVFCHPRILEMVLFNLIENAARAADANTSSPEARAVRIRVRWESGADVLREFGVIEILDTGGAVSELEQALKANGEKGGYGLPHAIAFFSSFHAQLLVSADSGATTFLQIKLPAGRRVTNAG